MKYVVFRGGLGNQIFQLNKAINLSLRYSGEILLETSMINDEIFNLNITEVLSEYNIRITKNPLLSRILVFVSKFYFLRFLFRVSTDTSSHAGLFYVGYWQKSSSFDNNFWSKISFSDQLVAPMESVMIHYRQGDYLKGKNLLIYHNLGFSYYEKSLKLMKNLGLTVENATIFSNNVHGAQILQNHLTAIEDFKSIEFSIDSSEDDRKAFNEMSKYQSFIIANSTYSLGAALIAKSKRPKSIIVGPKVWFRKKIFPYDILDSISYRV